MQYTSPCITNVNSCGSHPSPDHRLQPVTEARLGSPSGRIAEKPLINEEPEPVFPPPATKMQETRNKMPSTLEPRGLN